jgi:8-oxo-dGTP pyrophosphatase MutT (NUDIX family)
MTKRLTLVFLVKEDTVLLAMKKRGFGAGRWNGLGGKVNSGESYEQAMKREAREEAGVTPVEYEKSAEILFDEYDGENKVQHYVEVFLCDAWDGEPIETEEMAPKWFDKGKLPLNGMWDDDRYWLPRVLAGEKLKCHFKLDSYDKVVWQRIGPLGL